MTFYLNFNSISVKGHSSMAKFS